MRTSCRMAMIGLLAIALTLSLGGCPRPDDALEPNNTIASATPLTAGVPVTARVLQSTNDVFSIEASAGQVVLFRMESLGPEVCPLFTATGPDGTVLYQEPATLCRGFGTVEPETQVAGSSLTIVPNLAFELRVPVDTSGLYFITITEGSQADNIFRFSWDYRLTATLDPAG